MTLSKALAWLHTVGGSLYAKQNDRQPYEWTARHGDGLGTGGGATPLKAILRLRKVRRAMDLSL